MTDASATHRAQWKPAAHALARISLGLNVFMHGVVRFVHPDLFAAHLEHRFAGTFLAEGLVRAAAYGIIFAETTVGFLVLFGLALPRALVAGLWVMIVLQFGTAVIQDWNLAALQLIYIGLYAALLATVGYDRYSLDEWTRRARA